MNGYYSLLIEALQKQGFSLVRSGKGSHQVWCKGVVKTIVPFNCPSRHLANAILKQAGINHKF